MWPSEKLASILYNWANAVLIVGLVVGAISTVLITWMGNVKEAYLRRDLAALEIGVANARKAQAEAERALLELQERIRPRNLSEKQATDFVEALRELPGGTVDLGFSGSGGDESFNFAKTFVPLFKQAGWRIRNEASLAGHFDIQVIGVGILVSVPAGPDPTKPPSGNIRLTPVLTRLQTAFRAAGIEPDFISWFPGKDAPEVVIGSKPNP